MERELDSMPGPRFGFDYLQRCVVEILAADAIPADQETIVTARLRAIIEGERKRVDRLRAWNEKQAANAGT